MLIKVLLGIVTFVVVTLIKYKFFDEDESIILYVIVILAILLVTFIPPLFSRLQVISPYLCGALAAAAVPLNKIVKAVRKLFGWKPPTPSNNMQVQQTGKSIVLMGTDGGKCLLKLGMPAQEVIDRCDAVNIQLKNKNYYDQLFENQFFDIDYSIWFQSESNTDGVIGWYLGTVCIKTPLVKTEKGLRVNDLESKIEEVYGSCAQIENNIEEGHRYYTYTEDGITICFAAGKESGEAEIFDWTISLADSN